MATGRSSFAKRQRDMAKKAKAEAKRQRRFERGGADLLDDVGLDGDREAPPPGSALSNDEIMAEVADLHRRYDEGLVDLDTFDEQKALLMEQISID